MRKVFLVLFVVLTIITANAQKTNELLTNHDGYWFLYSERIEQFSNGEYLAKDTYYDDNSFIVVGFERDGEYNYVVSKDFPQIYTTKWTLINDKQIELCSPEEDVKDIVELTTNSLIVRYYEEFGNRKTAKISTYCFPDKRLSEKEALRLNAEGVKEMNGFTKF